jgi:hypothetical protein
MIDQELQAYCEGYTEALDKERAFMGNSLAHVDDWVVWRDYDINFFGADYDDSLTPTQLGVCAYPAGWKDSLPSPLYQFIVGESK